MLGNILGAVILGLVGVALLTNGYRWFRMLLPLWAFFFGLSAVTALTSGIFGQNFFSSALACIPGAIVGLVLAALSYFFFSLAVMFWAGSIGFAVAAGLLAALGINGWFIVGLVGIVGAIAAIVLASRAELKKYLPILLTACAGATMILSAVLLLVGKPLDQLNWSTIWGPLGGDSSIIAIGAFVALAVVGMGIQMQTNNRSLTVDAAQLDAQR